MSVVGLLPTSTPAADLGAGITVAVPAPIMRGRSTVRCRPTTGPVPSSSSCRRTPR